MRENKSKVIVGADPFYFEGNKIVILIIYGGGGGTCTNLKPLAEDLHVKGEDTTNDTVFILNKNEMYGYSIVIIPY